MNWKAGGDGKPVAFGRIPWHEKGKCPATGEPCPCREGGMAKSFCRDYAIRNEKSPGEPRL